MSELLAGEGYLTALLWTFGALALLVILLVAVRRMRGFNTGSLISGGRGRLPRLGVVEAAAVDNQRRLVLVRRDNVEHLILIGGPSDIVVEPQIQQPQPSRQAPKAAAQVAPPVQRSDPAPARPAQPPAQQSPAAPAATANSPERREPSFTGQTQQREAPVTRSSTAAQAATPSQAQKRVGMEQEPAAPESKEEVLLRHVDLSVDEIKSVASNGGTEPSVDDEMSRLLDEISELKDRG
ncbi:flagellar biosynthetic protein FliO [Chelativorans sp. YIM 93263]|uniref:flagellar biosynthetic protein FliO n=1 Tax=Chelativorans sp. YIM 93263 TaxID=2906648 RepID=UPI0023780BC2|nr:flagellar biosynthetic protein FliO [Chelativorans sp. YIM 93263]